MKLTKSHLKQIIQEELALVLEKGFGQGTPPSGEFYKKQEVVLEEEEELEEKKKKKKKKKKTKDNPWPICISSVGQEDEEKFKRCKEKVKRSSRKKKKSKK